MQSYLALMVFAAVVSQMQGKQIRSGGCPEPYDRLDDTRCILSDPFVDRTYTDAIAFCKIHGGNLLYIENCSDQILILDYINNEVSLNASTYWIGASDAAKEGTWLWDYNKKPVPMGNPLWHYKEPSTSTTDNCACISPSVDFRFQDFKCASKLKTICLRSG